MLTLVLGGAASGKSEYAETVSLSYGLPKIYLATMENSGAAAQRRIARHRTLRAEKGFTTVECPRNLGQLNLPAGQVLLLECVSNLFANEMYAAYPPISGMEAAKRSLEGIKAVLAPVTHGVIVSNNVFDDGVTYDPETEDYIQGLGWLNSQLAQIADSVIEVVCGIPILHSR
ncbi:MAG: bifunctional adenosylcobinamide kinase/adenosylcobinamide-phosphate guanylyltransferase [Negativibacillus sp.]